MKNTFDVKCRVCGIEESFPDLKTAYLCGWQFGSNCECWNCQKAAKESNVLDAPLNELAHSEF